MFPPAVLLAAALAAASPSPEPSITPLTEIDIPASTITAIEFARTPCFGPCPSYRMRITPDGRARFAGDDRRSHRGALAAQVDFRTLAAWIDTQHLEALVAHRYGIGIMDAPGIDLRIERGTDVQRFSTAFSMIFPLRLEGVVLALEGELQRAQWRAVDEFTPFLGDFLNDTRQLNVYADPPPEMRAFGAAVRRQCDNPQLERFGRTFRFRCEGGAASTVVETPDGFVAEGDAIVPGRYRRDQGGSQRRPLGTWPAASGS